MAKRSKVVIIFLAGMALLALKEKSNQTWSQEEDDYLIVAY